MNELIFRDGLTVEMIAEGETNIFIGVRHPGALIEIYINDSDDNEVIVTLYANEAKRLQNMLLNAINTAVKKEAAP